MNNHIIDRTVVHIRPLDRAGPRFPDANGAVFAARDHPFSLAVEGDARDVAGMAFEDEERGRVGGADVEELDVVVAGCGEEALVRRDAEAIYLAVGVLDCSGADSG
jgi:hypothetical protein